MLTPDQLALATERCHDLPADSVARFDRRITEVMNVTGRDRTWCRARAAETWPDEHSAYVAAKAPA